MNLRGQRVVLMGLGRFGGGVGAARFLVERGAHLLVTDLADESTLRPSLDQLSDLTGIAYRLGAHDTADFQSADLVVASPAVKPHNPYLQAARDAGAAITSEIRLLVAHLPERARTIGVTGTAGKSTTTAMIAHAMRNMADGGARSVDGTHHPTGSENHSPSIWLGGNLGGSLLPRVDEMRAEDWIVLELSSFMLEGLAEDAWSPHVAVLTNFAPNHLDWHGDVASYRAAKQAIFEHQSDAAHDVAVLGPALRDDFTPRVSDVRDFGDEPQAPVQLLVPGAHNRRNARGAVTAVCAATGAPERAAWEALTDFAGLPHRLQLVAEHAGVRYYNDSKATTPEAARLAIDSFPAQTAHLILGGSDKGSDLSPLATHAATRCRALYTIGDTGAAIARAARQADGDARIVPCGDLETALSAIGARLRRGDVVVLSPGCASYDQFTNFEQRGARFTEAVLRLTSETGLTPGP